eukprot:TRINITY_DN1728_c0_g5_i1.p1 TRINITY_DN1728_c0_g5~~TRINITY_DN1728_c0_g5_i1.p1  ORF type:complete len:171 (-),score=30.20 TRINITY_DN1728_c0_g5_i1:42-554(-)
MVLLFMLHCQDLVVLSQTFGPQESYDARQRVVKKVNSVLDNRRKRSADEDDEDGDTLRVEEGIYIVNEGLFPDHSGTIVLWRTQGSYVFSVVCQETENRALASMFLSYFPLIIAEHFKQSSAGDVDVTEFLQHSDQINTLLRHFLPSGQLLFTSSDLIQYLKNEAEKDIR